MPSRSTTPTAVDIQVKKTGLCRYVKDGYTSLRAKFVVHVVVIVELWPNKAWEDIK